MGKTLIHSMRCGCEFWEGLDTWGRVYPEMIYCPSHEPPGRPEPRILNGKPPVVIRTEIQELLDSPDVLLRNRGEMMEIELKDMLEEIEEARKVIEPFGQILEDIHFRYQGEVVLPIGSIHFKVARDWLAKYPKP